MMKKLRLAIVGYGFVGKAVDFGFNRNVIKKLIDPKLGTDISELVDFDPDVTFVAVPTPMGTDGSINVSIVESVIDYLGTKVGGLIVLKSTVTPDNVALYAKNYHNFVYNPEFLTEKAANEDFVNPPMQIYGGNKVKCEMLHSFYKAHSSCKEAPVHIMSAVEASLVKYGINSFLASKVLWFNQYYDTISKCNGNYSIILDAMLTDPRIGKSHTAVPGFDGKRGFGGACFPKDTAALLNFDPSLTVLREVIAVNNAYRSVYEKDDREKEQNINYN
jgi:UDPglucose 6-dehydrogenase